MASLRQLPVPLTPGYPTLALSRRSRARVIHRHTVDAQPPLCHSPRIQREVPPLACAGLYASRQGWRLRFSRSISSSSSLSIWTLLHWQSLERKAINTPRAIHPCDASQPILLLSGKVILHSLIASHYLVQNVNVQLREERGGWHSSVLTCWVITQAWGRNYLKQLQLDAERNEKRKRKSQKKRTSPSECWSLSSRVGLVPPVPALEGHWCHPSPTRDQGSCSGHHGDKLSNLVASYLRKESLSWGLLPAPARSNSLHPQSQGGKAGEGRAVFSAKASFRILGAWG